MPLVRNTTTGNNYLVKINTDGDTCSRTAVRSYNKQLGSQGSSGRTRFTLPFEYDPGSHTLWVFVNGVKAVVELSPINNRQYSEISSKIVQFGGAQAATDVLEFIVAGSYLNETDIGGASGFAWMLTSDNNLAVQNNYGYMVDTRASSLTLVLPASPVEGDTFAVIDAFKTFGANNLVLNRSGKNIDGITQNYILTVDGTAAQFVYDGIDNWVLGFDSTKGVLGVVAGTNIAVNNTDPKYPTVSVSGNLVNSVVAGTNIAVNNTDPKNPIVSVPADFVTRSDLYTVLAAYGLAKIDWFTYVNGKYIPRVTVANNSVQLYTVPTLAENTIIKCHLWGAGSGGYTYGEFILKSPANFVSSNPTHLYQGQILCIHVGWLVGGYTAGDYIGRAAIWRYDTPYFNAYNNELLVAGGGGGGGATGVMGGTSGWPYVAGGTAGSQTGGGVCPASSSGNGQRVWGGIYGWNTCDGYKQSVAGDGYFGGGAGQGGEYQDNGCRNYASGGGGGSGYFRPGIQNAQTITFSGPSVPNAGSIAYGMNAGVSGNPGRVAFEMSLG